MIGTTEIDCSNIRNEILEKICKELIKINFNLEHIND